MATSSHLFRVLSKPIKVDIETWENWIGSESMTGLIQTNSVTKVGIYQAFNEYPLATKTPNTVDQTKLHSGNVTHSDIEPPTEKCCLMMYQTDDPEFLKEQFLRNIGQSNGTLSGKEPISCAEWDSRVYKLVQDFDPKGAGYSESIALICVLIISSSLLKLFPPSWRGLEAPAPFILSVQMEPNDDDDYDKFYRDEHLYMLSKVPGYRRSQRYQLVSSDHLSLSSVPRFMAIHEFETLETTDGPELREADASPNTHRVIGNAKFVNIRGFRLVKTLGHIKQ
ncbi:hypothetical protein EDD37DRAFT_678474 [Exophiala viscosa]|uniref:uncharacterized protein n=1 Tax=Exophiala viscosa TaxID=2486360 RepID=UPI002197B5D8|nr:hypothetical protein EDD37DRAFT_678474 [Exophiala viscosa]